MGCMALSELLFANIKSCFSSICYPMTVLAASLESGPPSMAHIQPTAVARAWRQSHPTSNRKLSCKANSQQCPLANPQLHRCWSQGTASMLPSSSEGLSRSLCLSKYWPIARAPQMPPFLTWLVSDNMAAALVKSVADFGVLGEASAASPVLLEVLLST